MSSNTKAQYQTYSYYKSRNTHKNILYQRWLYMLCVKGLYSSSDHFITEDCNVVQKFTPGFSVMFDKGFVVQDIFWSRTVTVLIPPFVRSKRQFTPSEVYQCKHIATARIHIERVMGRLEEFRLLDHTLLLPSQIFNPLGEKKFIQNNGYFYNHKYLKKNLGVSLFSLESGIVDTKKKNLNLQIFIFQHVYGKL